MDVLANLVKTVARAVVTQPEQVKISAIESDNTVVLELQVATEDMGRVIGKGGEVANSLRRLLWAAAAAGQAPQKRVLLEIIPA